MGLFSQDRPRIPGDPPHLEIMTKIGHALPDKARRVLAASAMIGKGKFKGAKQVMTRKQPVPKLEEAHKSDGYRDGKLGMVDQKRYKSDKQYAADVKKGIKKSLMRTTPIDTSSPGTRVGKAKKTLKRFTDQDLKEEGLMKTIKDKVSATAKKLNTGKPRYQYDGNDPHELAPKEHIKEISSELAKKAAGKIRSKLDKKFDDHADNVADMDKDEHATRLMKMSVRTRNSEYNDALNKSRRKKLDEAHGGIPSYPSKEFMKAWKKHKESKADKEADKKKSYLEKKLGYRPGREDKLDEGIVRKIKRTFTNWATKQDLKQKIDKESDFRDKVVQSRPKDWRKKDPIRSKAIQRLTTLGKRHAALQGGNVWMPSWPKKPGDLKYMTKKKLDESIVKKISRAFNKATGIQRRGLQHAIDKKYKAASDRSDDYHEIYRDYEADYKKSGRKSDKKSMEYYKGKRDDRDTRLKDLVKRGNDVARAGKLEEAVSRKLIAKKNATKQRVRYVQRKGELPPIMKGKGRYKITNKETSKLKDILDKQKSFRRDAKNATLERKKGYTLPEPKAAETSAPVSSRGTSVSVFAKTPLPGEHLHNAQPHIAQTFNNARQDPVRANQVQPAPKKPSSTTDDLIRGYNHWTMQYGLTGDQKYHDFAKKAALTHYAAMIAKISHHPGHPEFEAAKSNAKAMLDSHLEGLRMIDSQLPKMPKPVEPSKRKLVDKIKGLFRK